MRPLQINEAGSNRRAETGRQGLVAQHTVSRHVLSSCCGLSTVRKSTDPVFRGFPVWNVCESCYRKGDLPGPWPHRGTAPCLLLVFSLESLKVSGTPPLQSTSKDLLRKMADWLWLWDTHSSKKLALGGNGPQAGHVLRPEQHPVLPGACQMPHTS